jgi:hypothetical protein
MVDNEPILAANRRLGFTEIGGYADVRKALGHCSDVGQNGPRFRCVALEPGVRWRRTEQQRRWRRRMGIEPTSDSDCRSTVLKLDKRTSPTWAGTAFPQVRGLARCPLLTSADRCVPLVMAREWHART